VSECPRDSQACHPVLPDPSAPGRRRASPLVRVCRKPDFGHREAILFRVWEHCLVLLVPKRIEPADVLAIEMPGDFDRPGAVVVGIVDQIALREDEAWLVSCVLRRPLSREVVVNTPTLFAVLCDMGVRGRPESPSASRRQPC
jgi:hypothetical protein